jgi:hypothetical protein
MTKERVVVPWKLWTEPRRFSSPWWAIGQRPTRGNEKRLGPAATLNGTVALSFVIPRVCNFIGFEKKLVLKTKGLGASKVGKSQ